MFRPTAGSVLRLVHFVRVPLRPLAFTVALAVCGGAGPAFASGSMMPQDELHVPVGVNVGRTWGQPGATWLLGGEASLVRWYEGLWYGVYTDYVQDLSRDAGRLGAGAEAGFMVLGVDGGYVRDFEADANGYRVRGLLSLFLVTAYAGGGALSIGPRSVGFYEGGLLLKVPLLSRADGAASWTWLPLFR